MTMGVRGCDPGILREKESCCDPMVTGRWLLVAGLDVRMS